MRESSLLTPTPEADLVLNIELEPKSQENWHQSDFELKVEIESTKVETDETQLNSMSQISRKIDKQDEACESLKDEQDYTRW